MDLCFGAWEAEGGHDYKMVPGCMPRTGLLLIDDLERYLINHVVSELDPPYLCTRLPGFCMGQGSFVWSGVFFILLGYYCLTLPPPFLAYSEGSQKEGIAIMTI